MFYKECLRTINHSSNSYAEEKLDDNELIEHYLPDVPVKGFLKPPNMLFFLGKLQKNISTRNRTNPNTK